MVEENQVSINSLIFLFKEAVLRTNENIHITEKVKLFAESVAAKFGVEIFDVHFRKEQHGYVLRIFIDKQGIGIEDCAAFSREISRWLDDNEDIIPLKYNLEVSTPGLNRPIRSIEDFKKYIGRKCKIETLNKDKEGRRHFTGVIKEVKGDNVVLEMKKDEVVDIPFTNIKKSNLEFEVK
jgi:ribosome maturation factor RimP